MEDSRSFEDVVRSIEMSEKDVDKILKAAKLSRNPKQNNERLEIIIGGILFGLVIVGMFTMFIVAMG